ncbi:MAG: ATP-dependent zinc protease [Cyanobacteria bacterium P01_A01_bin.135]
MLIVDAADDMLMVSWMAGGLTAPDANSMTPPPRQSKGTAPHLPIVGWRERLSLPQLGIATIKAKIDTGARTSSLYAFDVQHFQQDDTAMVRFKVHPYQGDRDRTVVAEAPLIETRAVRSSNGQVEERPVIRTLVQLGDHQWPVDITLTHRKAMAFRMLLGRQALRGRFLVNSGRSFLQSTAKPPASPQESTP